MDFADGGTRDIFNGVDSKAARATCPADLVRKARRKLDAIAAAGDINDLRQPPGNRLEQLQGDREGQHSIRINDRYRICFRWTDEGPTGVEIVDYH